MDIKGCITALITPFKDGEIDEKAFRNLIGNQIENGINGLVPCGTTGESPTLSHDEHRKIIDICIDEVNARIPVIAGTGSNSTKEAISLTEYADKAGADAALVVTPYYNKPTQRGLYLHFKAIADSVKIPIILYNIEGRTARNIETTTVAKLAAECNNIIGVKEASGSIQQAREVKEACGDDFIVVSGDDALTLDTLKIGGVGIISVISNIVPKDMVNMVDCFLAGNTEEAELLNNKLNKLMEALFVETNPIPIKTAVSLLGLCEREFRLPLCDLENSSLEVLKSAMYDYGVLK